MPSGRGSGLAKWRRAEGTNCCRLFMKVIGVKSDFRQITHNLQKHSLPTRTVEAYLIAADEARESEQTLTKSAVVG